MLQIDRTAGGWMLRWNEIQICPLITDVNELISLHQQLALLLALDIERQADPPNKPNSDIGTGTRTPYYCRPPH